MIFGQDSSAVLQCASIIVFMTNSCCMQFGKSNHMRSQQPLDAKMAVIKSGGLRKQCMCY